MIINVERIQGYTQPGYAELVSYEGKPVVVMGNSVQTRKDGTQYVWASNWATGERINASLNLIKEADLPQPSLIDVVRKVESWARIGNGDAMWWLGDFYEFGSRDTGANGGKALAYYLGAVRCEMECYDEETVERVLVDGARLFKAGHPEGVEDRTPSDVGGFLAKFREFRAFKSKGSIYFPDTKDWAECVAIAEALD